MPMVARPILTGPGARDDDTSALIFVEENRGDARNITCSSTISNRGRRERGDGRGRTMITAFASRGPAVRPRLAAPPQSPSGSVPTDCRFRTNDNQARAPMAQPRRQAHAHPNSGIDAPKLQAPLLEEPELATQHQALSFERPPGRDRKHHQADNVGGQPQLDPSEGNHAQSCHDRVWTRPTRLILWLRCDASLRREVVPTK